MRRHATSCYYFKFSLNLAILFTLLKVNFVDVFVNGDLKCVFRYNREHKGNFDNRDIKVTTFVLGKIKVETFEKQVKMNFRKAKNKIGLNENSIIKLFKKL